VIDATLHLPEIPGGKKLIYNHIEMPLTPISDFGDMGKTNPLFAKLDEICNRHKGLWNLEAEKYLLSTIF
jgi:L-sorbose 1-phosphate reductase